MNQRTKRGIESACRASKESEFPRYHLGAALYYKGILLATGCNSTKTSPLQKRLNAEREFDPNQSGVVNSLHAEIRALSKVKYLDIDFSKSTLYVYREYANGNKAMARPCPACMKYIKELGIKHICYSTADGIAEERVDAIPIIRCKDCSYFRINDENVPYCFNRFGLNDPEPNGFCNYGRVKDAID